MAAALTGMTIGLWCLARFTRMMPGQRELNGFGAARRLPRPVEVGARAEAFLAEPLTALVTVPVITVFGWSQGGLRLAALAPLSGSVVVITTAAKRADPEISLPSGHAAYALAVLGSGSFLFWRAGAWPGSVSMAAVAVAMGPVRALDGSHHPMDAVAGNAIGLAWLLGALLIVTPRQPDLDVLRASGAKPVML